VLVAVCLKSWKLQGLQAGEGAWADMLRDGHVGGDFPRPASKKAHLIQNGQVR
jgi:hypothetical protein